MCREPVRTGHEPRPNRSEPVLSGSGRGSVKKKKNCDRFGHGFENFGLKTGPDRTFKHYSLMSESSSFIVDVSSPVVDLLLSFVVDVSMCLVCCHLLSTSRVNVENAFKFAPTFALAYKHMTKWSVRSPRVYKPSLFRCYLSLRPHFSFILISTVYYFIVISCKYYICI
jgi:hypothetical protein